MQQVFHTWIWGSSAIPPCRSSPVLSGWMVNVGGQPFLGLSRDAQLGLSQGSTTFSHLPNASLELSHSDLWVLLYLSHQGSSPPIARFGRTASSRKGSGRPKRLPFKDYGGHCALRNLKCSRIFFVTLARSVPCHNSVSELFRQFLCPHDSHLLWHALWAVRSYIDRCVAFLIKSNQYNQTQLDSNEGVEPSQGWSEEMDSTWVKYMSVTAKGLNT